MGDSFDIKYKVLHPQLQMRLWVLALDANTSKVNLAWNPGIFRTSLAYEYVGDLEAPLVVRRYARRVGFNPENNDVNLRTGMVFRGFNFETTANFTKPAVGFNRGYGRKLLPVPDELSTVFNSANG